MPNRVTEAVRSVVPFDALEATHQAEALDWIASGAQLFRIAKPDVPPMHLVSYFIVVARDRGEVLLVDHRNAGLWLPPGGHVEPNERPQETVRRECVEELGFVPSFLDDEPLFISVTRTVGRSAGHVDVSLWYVLGLGPSSALRWDQREFRAVRWFRLDNLPSRAHPNLGRFAAKLAARLARPD